MLARRRPLGVAGLLGKMRPVVPLALATVDRLAGPAPGRPVTYGTTEAFLTHFGLDSVGDLPGVDELKGAGLLDSRVPAGFSIPEPHAGDELTEDVTPPLRIGVWTEYMKEMAFAFEKMRTLKVNGATRKPYTAQEALDECQERMVRAYARHQQSLALRPALAGRLP